ncbi:MAG: DHA2 family efflux MFS transporter permease subunit [Hahellaceae bacterium]|nr:DHA2 family efflux MFS transporter permease subunit [Hahellaceae bacterium]
MNANSPLTNVPRTAINPWLIAPLVALAAFMEVLDIAIANVSLRHIAGSLAASPEEATWILTAYLVTNAIALPVAGWMSEYFGRTRFFMACIFGFTVASMACGMATSLEMLIVFRALQGLAGGALQPVSQAILADAFPLEKRAMAFSVYGIAVVAAPAIGPTLGGWITDEYSWHWIFLINVPIGILLMVLIRRYVPDEPPKLERGRVDYFAFGLIALGLGSLQWVLDRGQHEDWFDSYEIILLSWVVVIALGMYIYRSLNQSAPIVDLKLYRSRNYAIGNVMMFILGVVLFGSTAMLPLFMQSLMDYTATDAGLVLSPGGLAIMFMMPVVGKLASHFDARALITVGLLVTAAALWNMGNLSLDASHETFTYARIWQMVGMSFLFIPINMLAYVGLPPTSNNQASSMLSLMRNLGGGVGISLLITFLARFGENNRAFLASNTSLVDPEWQAKLSEMTKIVGDPQRAMAILDHRLLQQAELLAYLEGFRILAFLFLILVPMVWWLKPFALHAEQNALPAH